MQSNHHVATSYLHGAILVLSELTGFRAGNLFWHAISFLFPKIRIIWLFWKLKKIIPRFSWIDLYKKNFETSLFFSPHLFGSIWWFFSMLEKQQPLQLSLEFYSWDFFFLTWGLKWGIGWPSKVLHCGV